MSDYNNRLQTNNSSLEDIIEKLNKLPNVSESTTGYPVEVSDSNIIINSTETGKIYKYIGETDNYCTNGYYYVIEEG